MNISSPEELYRYLRDTNTKVLANIVFGGSPGHQIWEIDYFLRRYICGELPREGKYLWIQRNGDITSTMAHVFSDHFRNYNLGMLVHDDFFDWASEITRMVPEFGIDVGLSHIKNSVLSRTDTFVSRLGDKIYYNMTNEAVLRATMDYHRTRSLTEGFYPWRAAMPTIDGELADLLGDKIDRLACIHFRKGYGNAGSVVPPESLLPSLEYLRDNGFNLVKVGTEPYPEEFERYEVVNYTDSPLRSFRNDLALLGNSKLCLINASGLENIPDVMDIPTVSYARWHLNTTPYSRKTIVLPTLLFDPVRDRLLNFAEQMLFFKTRQEWWEGAFFGWHFPIDRYTARVPLADEMLEAVKEAVALGEADVPLSKEQLQYNQLDEFGPLSRMRTRVSQFYLERHNKLL